jgi:hypothetical protein
MISHSCLEALNEAWVPDIAKLCDWVLLYLEDYTTSHGFICMFLWRIARNLRSAQCMLSLADRFLAYKAGLKWITVRRWRIGVSCFAKTKLQGMQCN